ncbi:DUF3857 domain-containing protein [Mucilaginibacter pallidiroseus]|uniref:DUF3857 domain-containing protein n=1 Tax=Mucilaginibacter pallidiroseus TaxID=2599295 RepID=A0A563UGV5_9SPHI|nr:DUF3857 domain-containing protein [Mucilaginibacter pallidiroseus]TWR30605.1 DUF3857 domain-containing protein [Mucilaginibacter pallidiroseus]
MLTQTKSLLVFALVLAGSILFSTSKAAQPVVHFFDKPSWLLSYKQYDKKIPTREVENGYFFQLFEEQIQVEKQADYSHVIKEIVSEAGIQNGSSISINFDPAYERLDVHQVIVWRNNVPQNRISPKLFKVVADEKELSRFIYQGSYTAYCMLDDIRKGDRIEYAYTITGRNPIFNNKFFRTLYLQSSSPFAQMYKSIQVPTDRKLNIKEFNNPVKATISNRAGTTYYEWNAYQLKAPTYSENQPSWFNNYAHLQISELNNWKEVTNWALSINPVAKHLSGALASQVALLLKNAGADKEKFFRSAVRLVQDEVRYMGVELGEYSHRANNPERVFNQRYGDCKDKSLLLISVLKAGGIDAHMVLVNSNGHIDDFLPSANAFDHAVIVAEIKGKQVWVDPTISYQRGKGTDIYFPNYGRGLVLKAGNDGLTSIPVSDAGKTVIVEEFIVPDKPKEKVKLKVISTYTLYEADRMRDRLASNGLSETEKNYLNYYTRIYPKIQSADSVKISDNEDNNELVTVEQYLLPDFLKKSNDDEGKFDASIYANAINDQLPNIGNKVSTPVYLRYPSSLEYTAKIVLKNGWNIEPENESVNREEYSFIGSTSTDLDTLKLNYQLNFLKDHIPVNKADEARDDFKKISDEELGYSFSYMPDAGKQPKKLNYWILAVAMVLVAGATILYFRIYRTHTFNEHYDLGYPAQPLGGWLILVTIGVFISTIALLINLSTNGYFLASKWGRPVAGVNVTAFNIVFTFEALVNTLILSYAVFCLVLLLRQRDILPKYIKGLYAGYFAYLLIDMIVGEIAFGKYTSHDYTGLVRTAIVATIWILYFEKSERVKNTFIIPYPGAVRKIPFRGFELKQKEVVYYEDDPSIDKG